VLLVLVPPLKVVNLVGDPGEENHALLILVDLGILMGSLVPKLVHRPTPHSMVEFEVVQFESLLFLLQTVGVVDAEEALFRLLDHLGQLANQAPQTVFPA